MIDLFHLGCSIKSSYGTLDEIGKDYTTEVLNLYHPLTKIKNKKDVWFGLNSIFPSRKEIELPIISSINCFIATFHGDPIDYEWINSSLDRLRKYKTNFEGKFILCSNYPKPENLPSEIKYFQIEHLHLLPRWYGDKSKNLARPAKFRQFDFSYLSYRVTWFRTALFALLYKLEKGILSFPQLPNFEDQDLINFLKQYDCLDLLDDLKQFLPLPIDSYFESNSDMHNAWSVNSIAYQNCLINVVNESSLFYHGHMSEKSFKPLISKTLPVYSNIEQIGRLREFGFKFNTSFYDNNDNNIIRQVNTLKNLLNLPKKDLLHLVEEFLEYNRNWFFDNFYEKVDSDNQVVFDELVRYVKDIVD